MKLLLDTHAFLWYITADPKLPATFRAASQDPANEVYLSVASFWEAVIKHNLVSPRRRSDCWSPTADLHGMLHRNETITRATWRHLQVERQRAE